MHTSHYIDTLTLIISPITDSELAKFAVAIYLFYLSISLNVQ